MSAGLSSCHLDERSVRLAGGCNFRDMGGYVSSCGRTTKWRALFRSGILDRLTEEDCATLSRLDIETIIDFRGNGERSQRPSKSFGTAQVWVRNYALSHADYSRPAAVATPEQRRQRMIATYKTMLKEQVEGYRKLFRTLDAATGPILFHCTGGKDRTGVAAALLLDLLNIPRETIVEDYCLTNSCFVRDAAVLNALTPPSPPELVAADVAYLQAMFESLDEHFGGSENYARELGMSTHFVPAIRDKYLE